ncbi:hypothetical protein HYZ41_01000 [archaeon]|nr:hypothetical protein [archaeon]
MPKIQTALGVMKTLFSISKEEWNDLDHKLIKVTFGVISFVVMALFWFYFIRHIIPGPF